MFFSWSLLCARLIALIALCPPPTRAILSYSSQAHLSYRQFSFAPNGVCIRPSIFYVDEERDTSGRRTFGMRNVPGEGDCMFLAVALATAASMGLGGNDTLLRAIAAETRDVVAQVLGAENGSLHIEGKRLVSTQDLLKSAAKTEGLTTESYLARLRQAGEDGGLYGGGPELTVLSNVLRRPISVYELALPLSDNLSSEEYECPIRLVGVFGDVFRDPCLTIPNSAVLSGLQPGAYAWHLHILVVDVSPRGEKHACALLPKFCDAP